MRYLVWFEVRREEVFGELFRTASAWLTKTCIVILLWDESRGGFVADFFELFLSTNLVLLHLLPQILQITIDYGPPHLFRLLVFFSGMFFTLKSRLLLSLPFSLVLLAQTLLLLFFLLELLPNILFGRILQLQIRLHFLLRIFHERQLIVIIFFLLELLIAHFFVFVVVHLFQQSHLVLFSLYLSFVSRILSLDDKIRRGISNLSFLSLSPLSRHSDLPL